MTREPFVVRASRTLVALYPRRLRDEYGTDMVQLVRDQCREEHAGRVALRLVLDLAINVPKTHMEEQMNRMPSPVVPLTYMAIAVGGLSTAIIGGSNVVTVVIGLSIAVVAAVVGVTAWRHTAPVGNRNLVASWWKFLLAGPVLVAVVLAAAGAGVDNWYLGMAVVLTAFVLTGVGLVLGALRLSARSRPLPS